MNLVSVYPNPVKDRLIIEADGFESVEVYNLVGQQVMASTTAVVDMGDMNQGIYFVRVVADGKTITKRIVKQ